MKSFKTYYLESENKLPVLSPKEKIEIAGVGSYVCKVDTGNDAYCVLHGENVDIKGDKVSFKTDHGKHIEKPLESTITINVGAGVEEKRPIVLFDIKIKGREYKNVKFSIGDRKDNDEKVLLGLKFLEPLNAVVKV